MFPWGSVAETEAVGYRGTSAGDEKEPDELWLWAHHKTDLHPLKTLTGKIPIHEPIVLVHCSRKFTFQCVLHLQKAVDMPSILHWCNAGEQSVVDISIKLMYHWETYDTFCFVHHLLQKNTVYMPGEDLKTIFYTSFLPKCVFYYYSAF